MDRIYQISKTVTPSAGTASFNTERIKGIMRSLIIKPATATTEWKITFTNVNSVIVYSKGTTKGNFIDVQPIPLYGIYTVQISRASVDEAFIVEINYVELQ